MIITFLKGLMECGHCTVERGVGFDVETRAIEGAKGQRAEGRGVYELTSRLWVVFFGGMKLCISDGTTRYKAF